jgi:hypothetical protein
MTWNLVENGAVDNLRKYLNVHIATINMLLIEYGLQSTSIANKKAVQDNLHIRERLEDTQTIVETLGTTISGQSRVIRNTNSLVTQLFRMVSGDLKASWHTLFEMVAKVW